MRAIVWTRYGGPEGLQLADVAVPVPKADEVRIQIHASSVSTGDCELRALRFPIGMRVLVRLLFGVRKPRRRILGQELSGVVEEVGARTTRFRKGDEVFGSTGFRFGAYAEYVCLPERSRDGALAIKPVHLTFEQGAAVPVGGLEALHLIRRAGALNGRRVVIYGAGGGIGTFAVQLAKHFGAAVTAVDRAEKLEMLRSIGADRVIDYNREDFTGRGETYDVIVDVVGKSPFSRSRAALAADGRYLLGNPRFVTRIRGWIASRSGGTKVLTGAASYRPEDLLFLAGLIETGRIRVVLDRRFPLEQMVEAHRYVDSGLVQGRVVVAV